MAASEHATRAALVLCGGRSRRMGTEKAALPFGSETMLERIVGIVSQVVPEVWLVAREGQALPAFEKTGETTGPAATKIEITRDSAEGRGPLAGIVAGLSAMRAERAFVTACDTPLLQPSFIDGLFALADGYVAAVPEVDGHVMTMCAVYSRALLPAAERLLARDELKPRLLLREPGVRVVAEAELREFDPALQSLRDCNTPDAYREALRAANLDTPR
jgi:molybdopterin-guanine dinucleotide biosynthesis protein A